MPADMQKTSLALPKQLWLEARKRALDDGLEFQELVARAIKAYLASSKKGSGR